MQVVGPPRQYRRRHGIIGINGIVGFAADLCMRVIGAVTFINIDLSPSSNSAPATSLYFDEGEQHGSLPMNGPSSSSYVASHPPLVSMDGALSDAATVPNTSGNLEQLIEGF